MKDSCTPFDRALTQAVLAQFADIPTREEDVPLAFTPAFEEDVRQYIEFTRRRKRYVNSLARIVAIAAIVGILMVSSSLISIGSVVEPEQDGSYIFHMKSVAYDDLYYIYEFYVDQEIADAAPDEIRDVYFPTYVPEGFIPQHRSASVKGASASWETVTGMRISYGQSFISGDEWRRCIAYDPANDIAGVFTLGDFEVFRLKTVHQTIYLWSDHQYYFELRADAGIDEETMQNVFESIEWMPDERIFEN